MKTLILNIKNAAIAVSDLLGQAKNTAVLKTLADTVSALELCESDRLSVEDTLSLVSENVLNVIAKVKALQSKLADPLCDKGLLYDSAVNALNDISALCVQPEPEQAEPEQAEPVQAEQAAPEQAVKAKAKRKSKAKAEQAEQVSDQVATDDLLTNFDLNQHEKDRDIVIDIPDQPDPVSLHDDLTAILDGFTGYARLYIASFVSSESNRFTLFTNAVREYKSVKLALSETNAGLNALNSAGYLSNDALKSATNTSSRYSQIVSQALSYG